MARTTILCRFQMAAWFTCCNRFVMTLRTACVLRRECDVSYRPEAAVIHRRKAKTPAGGVTVAAALAGCGGMNIYKSLWGNGRALNRERDGGSRGIDKSPCMRTVMAVRALLAGDRGRGMVNKPAHERRRVVTVAAVRRWSNGYVTTNHAQGIQSIVTGLTRDGVPRQDTVVEHTAHVEGGGVVADVTGLRNVAR